MGTRKFFLLFKMFLIALYAFAGIGFTQVASARFSHTEKLAEDCEFYINSIGYAFKNERNGKATWLEAEVSLNPNLQSGPAKTQRLNIASAVEYEVNSNGEKKKTIITAKVIENTIYLFIPYNDLDYLAPIYRKIVRFNFYIDILFSANSTKRLWLNSEDYTFQSVFWGYPYYYVVRGVDGGITYAQSPSPIYKPKQNCLRVSKGS